MKEYDEFRLVLSPRSDGAPGWGVYVDAVPPGVDPRFCGHTGEVKAAMTRVELERLRQAAPHPESWMKDVGRCVWRSLMTSRAAEAFTMSRQASRARGRGLRLAIVNSGGLVGALFGETVALCELPVEVLHDAHDFIALSPDISVSRRPRARPDASAAPISLPLKVTVAISTPTGYGFDPIHELRAIRAALAGLGDNVRLNVVQPATRESFRAALQDGPHVVHFIGHGDFGIVGDDATPVGYLGFTNNAGHLDQVDAEQFEEFFRYTDVRLVVLTACQSAAAAPREPPYPLTALDGVAQRLVGGPASVTAVVAMQFDLGHEAAELFSREFYGHLLDPCCPLDEAISRARWALRTQLKPTQGRAWITPTLTWRCQDSRVFSYLPVSTPESRAHIEEIEKMVASFRRLLVDIEEVPPEEWPGYLGFARNKLAEIGAVLGQRAALVPAAARAGWRIGKVDGRVEVPLYFHSDSAVPVTALELSVAFAGASLEFLAVELHGGYFSGCSFVAPEDARDLVELSLLRPAAAPWTPGESQVATLVFNVRSSGRLGLTNLVLRKVTATRGGAPVLCDAVDGAIIIDPRPPAPALRDAKAPLHPVRHAAAGAQ